MELNGEKKKINVITHVSSSSDRIQLWTRRLDERRHHVPGKEKYILKLRTLVGKKREEDYVELKPTRENIWNPPPPVSSTSS